LWKSKGATLKPTPTCVRRNNPGSQAKRIVLETLAAGAA
jgi:hypothetical protein